MNPIVVLLYNTLILFLGITLLSLPLRVTVPEYIPTTRKQLAEHLLYTLGISFALATLGG